MTTCVGELTIFYFFFFSSRRRHTRYWRDWSSDVCSSDLLRFGEPMGEPEDLGQRVGLTLHRDPRSAELLPHGDDHERQEHSVDDAQGGIDEAGDVVVLPADGHGHQALHHRQPDDRGEASPADDQDARDHAHQRRSHPPFAHVRSRNSRYIPEGAGARDYLWY